MNHLDNAAHGSKGVEVDDLTRGSRSGPALLETRSSLLVQAKANRIVPDLSDSESDEDISERVEQSLDSENTSIHANKQYMTQGSAPSIGTTAYYAMLQSKIQNLKNAVMPSDVQSLDVHPVETVREQASGTAHYRTVRFHVPKMDPNPAWERLLSLWLEDKSDETKRKYMRSMNSLRAFVNDIPPQEIDLHALRQWRTHIMEEAPERSRNAFIVPVKSFFKHLYDQQLIERDHGRGIRMAQQTIVSHYMVALTREQVQSILSAAKKMSYYLFATIYYAGLRVAEASSLTRARVTELENGRLMLHILGKGRKCRDIVMGEEGSHILKQWLEKLRTERCFPITTRSINRRLKTVLKRAHMSEHISPHWLRHAFATHLHEQNISIAAISKILGHSSVKTTEIYINSDVSNITSVLD